MQKAKVNLEKLADKLVALIPKLEAVDQRGIVTLYRLLTEGQPVSPAHLAGALGLSESHVRDVLERWQSFVYYDRDGSVIAFGGLALQEMPHRLEVDGRTLYAWCAVDSLFIPAILGKTARIESPDPLTKEKISLVVGPTGVSELTPASAVVSFLERDTPFDADVIKSFCHFVHYFGSTETGAKWTSKHEGTFLLSVDEAYELGRLWNARNFPHVLAGTAYVEGMNSMAMPRSQGGS